MYFYISTGSGSTSSQNSDPAPGGDWQRTHRAPPQGARPASCSPELLAHSPGLTTRVTKADEELFLAGDGESWPRTVVLCRDSTFLASEKAS